MPESSSRHARHAFRSRHAWLLGLALIAAVSSNGRNPAACGPFLPEAVFTYTAHPDLPMEPFARGRVGIVQPTYARSYLIVFYRHLSGLPVTREEARAIVAMWDRRLGRGEPVPMEAKAVEAKAVEAKAVEAKAVEARDVEARATSTRASSATPATAPANEALHGVAAWRAARRAAGVTTEVQYAVERAVPGEQYQWYDNIPDAAFDQAASTLQARLAHFGQTSPLVHNWLAAQDLVFTSDKEVAAGLVPLGADTPALARADRAYQIAAAHFYAGAFTKARERFQAIAADSSSPWRAFAPYLAARALLRLGTVGQGAPSPTNASPTNAPAGSDPAFAATATIKTTTPADAERALTQAIAELRKVAADEATPPLLRESSRGLIPWAETWRALVITDQGRTTAIDEAGRTLVARAPGAEIGVALDRYTRLLDRRLLMRESARAAAAAETPTTGTRPAGTVAAGTVAAGTANGPDARANRSADNGANAVAATTPADLLEWLTIFQRANEQIVEARAPFAGMDAQVRALNAREATAVRALAIWRQRKTLPWLVAVLAHARPTTTGIEDAVQAADAIDASSPAFATLAFHRARLRLEAGDLPGARTLLDRAIAWGTSASAESAPPDTLAHLPASALNDLRTLRLRTARSLEEFLADGAKRSISERTFGLDDDIGSSEERLLPAADPSSAPPRRVGMEMLDKDAAEGLNRLPLGTLASAAESATLPAHLQYDLAVAGWTRAVLLGDDAVGARLAPRLRALAPVLAPDLDAYVAATTPDERRTAAVWAILRHPGLSPIVRPGFARLEPLGVRDALHDNWWCGPRLSLEEFTPTISSRAPVWPGEDEGPAFLSSADRAAAGAELERLKPASATWLARETVAWAGRRPEDPRLPEALHRAVLAGRFGCTDPGTAAEARRAFNLLHTRFPSSSWARQTRYWYK